MDIHPIRPRRCHRGRHRPTSPPAFGSLAEGRRRGGRLERGPVTRRLRSAGTCCTGRDRVGVLARGATGKGADRGLVICWLST